MLKQSVTALDENLRRYYLDVMGVQCWELLVSEQRAIAQQATEQQEPEQQDTLQQKPVANVEARVNRDVAMDPAARDHAAEVVDWPRLEAGIQQCKKCSLHVNRLQAVSGRGSKTANLMFVMLSPDISEEAYHLLGKMLAAINVSINDVYITSLLKCSVPQNHTVSPKEVQSCNGYLKQQVQLVKPELVVILGETATRCLMQQNLSLDDYRASNGETQYQIESIPLFVSYSPQELLSQADNKRKAWSDLQQIQKII